MRSDALLRAGLACAWWSCLVWAGWSVVSAWLPGDVVVIIVVASLPLSCWEAWHEWKAEPGRPPTADALRLHRDPGPDLRTAVDERARDLLRPSPEAWWIGGLSVALAAGSTTAAVLRDQPVLGLPAVLLLALAAWMAARVTVMRSRARRWLTDPPYPVDATPAES
ncbi:hypothetical protein [Modestobacter versicolor]|uniref:Uncharacterized protein n=1 Tax=Modestobacter versicolor TaxID=429133 RepID=A0A323V8W1_9ACTN|nr:hypothetical protein [Modestobacter versicolor]MBB3675463.1 hypothetical protein [Modestobacter versicolor]PZA19746.1 hypothetical protein DMO24_19065 [Modestobacter versicolor]